MPERKTPQTAAAPARESVQGNSAWMRLRHAVASEYIAKLPQLMSLDEFAWLTGMPTSEVRRATMTGELIVSLRDGRYGIAPADNVAFLVGERLLRLIARPAAAPKERRRATRTLEVSTATYERVWDEAVRAGISPREALDRLLSGS
jgi:hypothetical protein